MKLPKRVKVKKGTMIAKNEPLVAQKREGEEKEKKKKRRNSEDEDYVIYSVIDHRDSNYCYTVTPKFYWRRSRSGEILINVMLNRIDPKSIKNVEKMINAIKIPTKCWAFPCLFLQKFMRCHLSSCIKKMNLSIKHYLRVQSDLMFQFKIKILTAKKWKEITKDMTYTYEELAFSRSLVKNGFGELALMGDWNKIVDTYTKTDRFKYFKMYEEELFKLNLVQKGTEDVKVKVNDSLIDLRSNLSLFSTRDDLSNLGGFVQGNRSRSNSFSDSHSFRGQLAGLEQFNLF